MKNKKSWTSELAGEYRFYAIVSLVLFSVAYFETKNIVYSLIFTAVSAVLLKVRFLFSAIVQRKAQKSKRYRLPLIKCKGKVAEKHTHKNPQNLFLREWIIFSTLDGQQIKAYIPSFGAGEEHRHLATFSTGDTGILYYRKDKKFNHFEEFYKSVPVFDDELEDDLEDQN